ncbi:MAG: hypothetical protein ABW277_25860 [Longimicrobiaceae bacterium]
MAKNESTRGKGAKDGAAARAASDASPGSGDGGAAPGKTAAKSAAKTPAAKRAAALGTGGAPTGDTASGGGAKRATAKKSAGGGTGAGMGDGSPGLEGGAGAAKKRSGGAAAKKSSGGTGAAGGGGARKGGGAGAGGGAGHSLGDHLRQFARSRPQGWGHGEWLGLLEELRGHGHDVSDEGAVGRQLERERLVHQLEGVDGLGNRTDALADHFGTLYSLRHAGVDEIAGVQGMDRQTAERIRQHLR